MMMMKFEVEAEVVESEVVGVSLEVEAELAVWRA
jgi:hypothetical protein